MITVNDRRPDTSMLARAGRCINGNRIGSQEVERLSEDLERLGLEGGAVSALIHREGARQITVHDECGREAILVTEGETLNLRPSGEGPHLTPQMAHDLADELHQWAALQQTIPHTRRAFR